MMRKATKRKPIAVRRKTAKVRRKTAKARRRRKNIAPAVLAAGAASGIGSYLGTRHGMKSRKNLRRKNAKFVAKPIASGRPVKASDYFAAIKKGHSPKDARTIAEQKRYGFKLKRGKKKESFGSALFRLVRNKKAKRKPIAKSQRGRVS